TPLESSPSNSRISISTLTFLALRSPTGVGTLGGEVSSATISRWTGISAAFSYSVFSFLPQERTKADTPAKQIVFSRFRFQVCFLIKVHLMVGYIRSS